MRTDGRPWRFLIVAYLAALVVRLLPLLLALNLGIGLDDMFQYDMLARSLVEGKGYRWYAEPDLDMLRPYVNFDLSHGYDPQGVLTSFRAPLYPFFLADIYWLSGLGFQRFLAARLAQAFLGALLAPLTCLAARALFPAPSPLPSPNAPAGGRSAGAVDLLPPPTPLRADEAPGEGGVRDRHTCAQAAAWVVAFYPILALYPLALATENLFFILVLTALLALMVAGQKKGLAWFALAGLLFGLAMLTRSVVVLGVLAAAVWAGFVARRKTGALVLLLAAGLVVAPWVARNSLLHGRFSWIEDSLGYNMYLGYHPQGTGTFQAGISLDLLPIINDHERSQVGMLAARYFIRTDPLRAVQLCFNRLGYFFDLEYRALLYFYSNGWFGIFPLPILFLAWLALALPFMVVSTSAVLGLARPWTRNTWLVVLFGLGYLLPNVLVLSEERFHLVLIPLLAIFAARAWTGWNDLRLYWRTHTWVLALAVLVILLLACNWGVQLWGDAGKLAILFGPNGNQGNFSY